MNVVFVLLLNAHFAPMKWQWHLSLMRSVGFTEQTLIDFSVYNIQENQTAVAISQNLTYRSLEAYSHFPEF